MRNLKKLISLVLVVAMIASLCVAGMFSASAAEEVSKYPNAADVITTLKIMEGDEGGMRYGDTVTREEAATIICRLILSPDVAKLLKNAVNAPFEDTTGWSAGYVAYLKDKGIVNGKTATTFDPKGKVTGLEFAKMLLTALGYGKAGEYVGASWDINTIVDANTLKVFAGTQAADLTAPATREECMLYAYNVLFKNTVAYSKDKSVYESTDKLLAEAFNLGKAEDGFDAFGRLTKVYKIGDKIGVTTPNTAAYKGTFTALNSDVIYDAIGAASVALTTATVWTDGVAAEVALDAIKDGDKVGNKGLMEAGGTAELYYADGKLTVVVYYEYIGKAEVAKLGGKIVYDAKGNKVIKVADMDLPEGFTAAENDMVLYTKANGKMMSASVVEGIVGAYTANKVGGKNPTVAGVAYTYSPKCAASLPTVPDNVNYTIYTDSKGAIIYAVAAEETVVIPTNYLYLIEADAQNYSYTPGSGLLGNASATEAKAVVKVAYTDGKIDLIGYTLGTNAKNQTVASLITGYDAAGKPVTKTYVLAAGETDDAAALKAALKPGWYAYTAADDGTVSLAAVNATYAKVGAAEVTVAKANRNVSGISGMIATSNTVENIIYNGKKAGFVTATGYLNFAGITAPAANVLFTYAPNSTQIAAINVYVAGDEPGAPAPKPEMVYVASVGNVYANGTEYNIVMADGTTKQFIVAGGDMAADMVLTLTYNEKGEPIFTKVDGVKAATIDANGVANNENTIALVEATFIQMKDGTFYELNSKDPAVIVDVTGAGQKAFAAGQAISFIVSTPDASGYSYITNAWIVG